MPSKNYEELAPKSQQVIDAAIYITEAERIMGKKNFDDEREMFASDQSALVNYLRSLYALDMQTTQPRYFAWRDDSAAIIRTAMDLQQNIFAATDGVSNLTDLIEHLTNLSYPENSKGRSR